MLKRLAQMLENTKSYPPYLAVNIVFRRSSFAIHPGVTRQMVARHQEHEVYF